ncbi:MAG: hypothetical protein AAGI30_03170 [Planctomycetota bacterium]
MHRVLAVLVPLAICLGACASPEDHPQVLFRAVRVDVSPTEPLARAYVRAIPVVTNELPLPVTAETLEEAAATAETPVGFTGADGTVALGLYPELPYIVEVLPPITSDLAARSREGGVGRWSWRYEPGTGEIASTAVGDANDGSVQLELVEPR